MLTEQQLAMRKLGIGASEISVLLGLNPYTSPLDLYYEKVGEIESKDLSDNEFIYWGNALEEPIAKRYAELNSCELVTSDTIFHPQYPFLFATPDRLISGTKKGIEIKTTDARNKNKWQKEIPAHYLMQCHQCMLVTDSLEWDLCALIGGNDFQVFTIKRDKEMDAIIINVASKFWNEHVLKQIPPPVDYEFPNVLESIKKMYNEILDEQIDLDADVEQWIKVWNSSKAQISNYEKSKKAAEAHILQMLGNNGRGILPDGGHLVRKTVKRKAYEVKACEYNTLSYYPHKEDENK